MGRALEPLVALTGAGVSAESGVPTFRGPDGLWERRRPEELANQRAFARHPLLVWRFYAWRRSLVARCSPNAAHLTLADIEDRVGDFTLITQNVDGLHGAAGNLQVIELHGSLWRLRCTRCLERWEDRRVPFPELPPRCPSCGGLARPDVVWFGESLEQRILDRAMSSAARARIMLVVGTSAVVHPAAQLPLIAKNAGAWIVEINPEETPVSAYADEVIRGPAAQVLPEWWAHNQGL